jgi:nitrogenase molybdenum-iron protein alpha/beta subunit
LCSVRSSVTLRQNADILKVLDSSKEAIMSIGNSLLQRWTKPEETDKKLILESQKINNSICKAARSAMTMLHHYGILFNEKAITFLTKDNTLSSLITTCNFINKT